MSKDKQDQFYKTQAWKKCRAEFVKSKKGLCELCLEEGRITSGEIVHHKRHIDPDTITDPNVLLSWDNLQLLCRKHHGMIHRNPNQRYYFDEKGKVYARTDCPLS